MTVRIYAPGGDTRMSDVTEAAIVGAVADYLRLYLPDTDALEARAASIAHRITESCGLVDRADLQARVRGLGEVDIDGGIVYADVHVRLSEVIAAIDFATLR